MNNAKEALSQKLEEMIKFSLDLDQQIKAAKTKPKKKLLKKKLKANNNKLANMLAVMDEIKEFRNNEQELSNDPLTQSAE